MQNIPKVAIITRTRNRNDLLRRAIQSVLQQNMQDWHHWIINDGGDAQSLEELLSDHEDAYAGRFSLLTVKHAGMQKAANTAIKESDSEYIAIHDDDDSWHPDYLQETTSFLDGHGADSKYQGVITKTERILETEQEDGSFLEEERKPYVPLDTISLGRLGYENPFPPIAFLYRRSILDELGEYNPDWDLVADLDFNYRFLQKFEIGVIDKVLAFYHWRKRADSNDSLNTVTLRKTQHERLLNELKNHYLRDCQSTEESTMALAFLVSSYAVENQWMTSEIRERSIATQQAVKTTLEGTRLIQQFNEKAVFPKLEELSELLHLVNTANSQLEEIRKFNNDTTWPKLEANENKNDAIQDRVESSILEVKELKSRLDPIGKLEGISAELAKLGSRPDPIAALENLAGEIKELGSRLEPVARLEAIHSLANQLKSRQEEILDHQNDLADRLVQLQKEVDSMRREEWKLGPFRISRVKSQPDRDPEDSTK